MLIVTNVPWLYKPLRDGLGLTEVVEGASGVEYEMGRLAAPDGVWNVVLPADMVTEGSVLVAETSPTLVVFVAGKVDKGVANEHPVFQYASAIRAKDIIVKAPLVFLRKMNQSILRGTMRSIGADDSALHLPDRLCSGIHGHKEQDLPDWVAITVSVSISMFINRNRSKVPSSAIADLFSDLLKLFSVTAFGSSGSPAKPSPPPPAPTLIPIPGTLAGFSLTSVRMFEQVSWPQVASRPGWHVVLGDNASGKTSLLRALALALLPRAERDALRQDWSSWLRHDAPRGQIAVTLADHAGPAHTLVLSLERAARGAQPASSGVDVRSSETMQYDGFLAGYGPFRRFTGGDPEWLNTFRAHPRTQRLITLFEERAALSDALEWLKDLWVRAETTKPAPPEKAFLKQLLSFINDTGFLPPDVTLLEPDPDGVWCHDANGRRIQVIELSDGYRAALSLTLDLVRHLTVEYGHAKVFTKTKGKPLTIMAEGIVLIDEPDAHLHPTWQQRLGGWFKRFFPRMQFVVSTHSPIVCQAADSVLLLPVPGQDEPARMASPAELDRLRYGDVLDAFATDFFGRKVTRSEAGRTKLARLAALNLKAIQSGLDEAETAEQEQLRGTLGTVGAPPGGSPGP